jgi:hypothetical protein
MTEEQTLLFLFANEKFPSECLNRSGVIDLRIFRYRLHQFSIVFFLSFVRVIIVLPENKMCSFGSVIEKYFNFLNEYFTEWNLEKNYNKKKFI